MVYFPNGTAGMVLDAQCAECLVPGDAPCPVLNVQLTYNYEQIDKQGNRTKLSEATNLLVNEKGICQMKPILDNVPLKAKGVFDALKKYNDDTEEGDKP